jgi:hypothetical protein
VQGGDELAWVLDDEVGAELERGRARLRRPELPARDDAWTRVERDQRPEDSATTSGCSDSTSAAMSWAGAPGPRSRTSQPSASRKSATIRIPTACNSSGVPETTARRPSLGVRVSRRESPSRIDCATAVA